MNEMKTNKTLKTIDAILIIASIILIIMNIKMSCDISNHKRDMKRTLEQIDWELSKR